MTLKKTLLITGALILLLGGGLCYAEATKIHTPPPVPTRGELLQRVNAEREKVGDAPLTMEPKLNTSAQIKADDMLKFNYFDHYNPITGKRGVNIIADNAKDICQWGGEVLDEINEEYLNTSAEHIRRFMASPPHREALLDPKYDLVGFGIAGTKVVGHLCQSR